MTDAIKTAAGWVNFMAKRTLLFAQVVGVLLLSIFVAMALETRAPPFEILPHPPIEVQAGQWAELRIPVSHDRSRRCSVHYSRKLIDSDGSRFDLPGGAETADGSRRNEGKVPGVMKLMIQIPPLKVDGTPGIDHGVATLTVTRAWVCNPLQELWPIRADTVTQLYVLP